MQPNVPLLKRQQLGREYFLLQVSKLRLCFLVTLLLFFGVSGIQAQNANLYAFSTNNTGSMVLDRNGNTVTMSSGTTQLIGANQDDVASSVTNIGFSFNFMGTSFTQFTASSNGALRLGGSAISNTTIGTSFPINNQSIIAPYLQDIETHSNGKVHFRVVGSAPNRTLVVEFLNMRINFNSTTSDATFQARLYETTNVVEFVYANMSVGSTAFSGGSSTDERTAVIGFCNDNDNNEEISVNQSTYATTTNSSPIVNTNSSTGAIAGLNSAADGSRRRFTFIPPTVNTSAISGSPFCAGAALTVNFTSAGTFTSNTYTAQLSNSSGSFASPVNIGTLASNANSGAISATIPANTTTGSGYRIRVTSSNSNTLSFDNGVNLTINARPTLGGASSVCVGNTANVTPASGGTWASSNNLVATVDNSGLVTSVSAGAVTLTYTETTTGCSNTASFTVNGDATLSLTSAGSTTSQTVCIITPVVNITYLVGGSGTGATVSGLPAGVTGTYNGGTNTYTISGSPTVSGGPFSYSVTTTGPCGNVSLGGTIQVTAASTLALISGVGTNLQTLCANTSLTTIVYQVGGTGTGATLSGTLPAGVSGSYDGDQNLFFISGTPTGSGTFNYTVTTTGPCANPSLGGTITVNPAPTVSLAAAPGSVCLTQNSTLTATNGGGSTQLTYSATGAGVGIPNASNSAYAYSTATLAAGSAVLSATDVLQVTLNVDHNDLGEVDIFLVDPSGTRAMLLTTDNGGSGNDYINTVLNTTASTIIGTSGGAPYTGTFRPEGTITTAPDRSGAVFGGNYNSVVPANALNGAPITGAWTLRAFDDNFGATGSVLNWTLSITKLNIPYATSFSGPATITPAAPSGQNINPTATVNTGVGSHDYTATTTDAKGCSTTSAIATVVVNPVPDAPISGGNQTECEQSPIQTLTATATGVGLTWFDAATGGNIVAVPTLNTVGTVTYYAESFDGTCASLTRTPVTLTINAAPAAPTASNQIVCSDGSPTQTLTATASGGTITWYDAASGGNVVGSPVQVGVGTSTYYAESSNGICSSLTRTLVVLTINAIPGAPVSGGDQTQCEQLPIQTLTATATGVGVTWHDAATGGNIVAVPGLNTVGTVTYYAESFDGTCSSLSRTPVTLTITGAPAAPTASNQYVCSNGNPGQTLTATASGGTITWFDAATNGNVVTSPTQVGVGISTYYAESFDGTCTSLTRTPVVLSINLQPATPNGINGNKNVCPFVGTGQQLVYSITPVLYAQTYRWTLPPHVNLISASPDSTSITVTFDNTFGTSPNKQIRVRSLSSCGNSGQAIIYLTAQYANTPQPITGPTDVCPYLNNAVVATYTIPKVTAATSYIWSTPTGATVNHPAGPGENDTIIEVTYDLTFTTSAITVRSENDCGVSSARSITVVRNQPPTPSLITGTSNACAHIGPLGTDALYTIRKVTVATSYNWTAPAGATVTHQNAPGINDTAIFVRFPVGFNNGAISVTATNNCGTSTTPRNFAVGKLSPATPGVIDVIQLVPCPNRQYSYTIAVMPSNAASVQWTVPATAIGFTGQGTTSIIVTYPGTTVIGNVTATAVSNCGNSVTRVSEVKLPACAPEAPRPLFTRSTEPQQTNESFEVKVYPNPSTASFNLKVLSAGKEKISVRVLDVQGRALQTWVVMPYQQTIIGGDLKPGTYLVEVIQGRKKTTQQLIKL